jgi:hypothetical protein
MVQRNTRKWKMNVSPSRFIGRWIRPKFCQIALFAGGDGVVKTISLWLFYTTSPKSKKVSFCYDSDRCLLDFGTPPQQGGEISVHSMKNELLNRNHLK